MPKFAIERELTGAAKLPPQEVILAALPADDYARLLPDLELVPMPLGWAVIYIPIIDGSRIDATVLRPTPYVQAAYRLTAYLYERGLCVCVSRVRVTEVAGEGLCSPSPECAGTIGSFPRAGCPSVDSSLGGSLASLESSVRFLYCRGSMSRIILASMRAASATKGPLFSITHSARMIWAFMAKQFASCAK